MNNTGTYYTGLLNLQLADDLEALEKTVKENPTSSIARFMLLNYYKINNHPAYEHFSDQSLLYFNNPYWIQLQLSGAQKINEEDKNVVNDLSHIKEETEEKNTFLTTEKEDAETSLASEEVVPSQNIENPFFTEQKEETFTEATVQTNENEEAAESENTIESENASLHQVSDVEKDNKESADGNSGDFIETAQFNNGETDEHLPETSNTGSLKKDADTARDNSLDQENEEETIEFEPLYTVDYFASQGIKIKEEALSNDKLGQQVKSFTAWLKSMKKLHPGKLPEQNEVIERIIQSSAEESNVDAEVLTEAMAEVLIKQNKQEKAIEMYRKLSLLNPAKSTYFAAKIESIKIN